jgi:hypothetical protein
MCFSSINSIFSSASSFLKPVADIAAPLLAVGAAAGLGKQLLSPLKQGNSQLAAVPTPAQAKNASSEAQERARTAALADSLSRGSMANLLDPETGARGVPINQDLWGVGKHNRLI